MKPVLLTVLAFIGGLFHPRLSLQAEIMALRHQLAVYAGTNRLM